MKQTFACLLALHLYSPCWARDLGATALRPMLLDFADILRDQGHELDEYLKDPAFTAVTTEYGYSIISTKNLPVRSILAEANLTPWSSWWYPKKDKTLFLNGEVITLAPLVKYDLARKARHPEVGSAAEFEQKHYSSQSTPWEGLCDAWSIASIMISEPKYPVTLNLDTSSLSRNNPNSTSLRFEVGDIKALILKSFEAVDDSGLKYYGQKFTGDEKGWIYPDIFPEQFHRLVEVQLFQKKQPFIMDHDPGPEVWNVPVYKANFIITAVPEDPNSVFVRTWLYSAESLRTNDLKFVGTREGIREYNYVLKGERNINGDLVIKSGYWVKGPNGVDSRKDHPDYIIVIPDTKKLIRKSWNPEIDIRFIDELVTRSQVKPI